MLLKRGISATIEEWLLSAEYILAGGNTKVMLCERGIRTFESYTRNTLDISAIPVVHKLSHLPVLVDPSHGTGRRDKVAPMARAAVAAGADGLLIEVHCDPDHALQRRRAVAVPVAIRPADGGTAHHRPRHRPQHLPRAGHAPRLGRLGPVVNLPMAADREPPFAHVAIVGFGLIGGSLGMAIRERWPKAMVIAIDRKDVVEAAMQAHAADLGGDDLGLAAGAELVVLAAPVRANIEILSRLDAVVPGPALVTDVGSTKRAMADAARALPGRFRFVGGHPLAGAAVGGFAAARADLFEGRPWILAGATPESEPALVNLLGGVGARVRAMTPEAHDALLAYISHLPQITASALMSVVGPGAGEQGLAQAGRGLRDTTRLASSPAAIWRDIADTNRDHLAAALDGLIAVLAQVRAGLATGGAPIDDVFAAAAQWKRVLEEQFEP